MLFSVCSDTGTDLCRGGTKRYFSCNIQVGDGLLNNSFYMHKQTCSVPFECHTVIKLDALSHNLDGSFLWDSSNFTVPALKEGKLGKTVTLLLLYETETKYYGSLLGNSLVHV